MGQIKVREMLEVELYTRLYVDAGGAFVGELAPPQAVIIERQRIPEGYVELPEDAPLPPSHKHIWDGKGWQEPEPTEQDKRRAAEAAAKQERRNATLAKLDALGFSPDELKDALS